MHTLTQRLIIHSITIRTLRAPSIERTLHQQSAFRSSSTLDDQRCDDKDDDGEDKLYPVRSKFAHKIW